MDSCAAIYILWSEPIKFLNIDNVNVIRNKLDLVFINKNLSPPLPTNGENLHFAIEMSAMF